MYRWSTNVFQGAYGADGIRPTTPNHSYVSYDSCHLGLHAANSIFMALQVQVHNLYHFFLDMCLYVTLFSVALASQCVSLIH